MSTSQEITGEYPAGKRSAEMVLVEMLTEKRSWADYTVITSALWNLRHHAGSMESERTLLSSAGQAQEATDDYQGIQRAPTL